FSAVLPALPGLVAFALPAGAPGAAGATGATGATGASGALPTSGLAGAGLAASALAATVLTTAVLTAELLTTGFLTTAGFGVAACFTTRAISPSPFHVLDGAGQFPGFGFQPHHLLRVQASFGLGQLADYPTVHTLHVLQADSLGELHGHFVINIRRRDRKSTRLNSSHRTISY